MNRLLVQLYVGGFAPPQRLQSTGGHALSWDRETGAEYVPIRWADISSSPLSRSQRQSLDMRARMRAPAAASPLRQMVDETLATLEKRRAEGAPKERLWTLEANTTGTRYLGDVFERD